MKTQIIGLGIVGKAQAFLLNKLGHVVYGYDIKAVQPEPYFTLCNEPIQDIDITFICTPEQNVEDTIKTLTLNNVKGLFTIKSTVPVGTTKDLIKKYDCHICHNPEFLREKHYLDDVMNPDRIVIGQCCKEHGQLLADLYSPLGKSIFLTMPIVSELAKLISNVYLSTLITFWNEMAELTEKLNVDIKEVAELVCADHRMSHYGTVKFGEPFEGKCLPKDVDQLINIFRQNKLNPSLFEAVKKVNEGLR